MGFTDLLMADRERVLFRDKDITVFYEVFQKYLGGTIEELKSKYTIVADFYLNRITIKGSLEDIFILHSRMMMLGMQFESVTCDSLRIDIYKFLRTMR